MYRHLDVLQQYLCITVESWCCIKSADGRQQLASNSISIHVVINPWARKRVRRVTSTRGEYITLA